MRRMILCGPCVAEHRSLFATPGHGVQSRHAGEFQQAVAGVLRRDCLCDFCNRRLRVGDRAVAEAVWVGKNVPREGAVAWAAEFMEVDGNSRAGDSAG